MKVKDFTNIYEGKFSLENVENREGLSQQLVGFIRDNKDLIKIIMDEKE